MYHKLIYQTEQKHDKETRTDPAVLCTQNQTPIRNQQLIFQSIDPEANQNTRRRNTVASAHETETLKKDLCAIFNKYCLKVTTEANKKIVNFLDVALNLTPGKYQPHSKPNNIPFCIHSKSNSMARQV